jgi:ribosomal protein S18 acetylase RimI-like enzyme
MFEVRKAIRNDFVNVLALYKKVAAMEVGIARRIDEISPGYIQHFMENAAASGIELVVDNPDNNDEIIAEIHCSKMGPSKFDHVLTDLTVAVSPAFQGKGIGKLLFNSLFKIVENEMPHILRVELVTQESNASAIALYTKLGFQIEGRFEGRILVGTRVEADIPMAWFNPKFLG